MGNDSGKGKKPKNTTQKREVPLTIGALEIVGDEPTNPAAVTIAQSERKNFDKSVDAYGRTVDRPKLSEEQKQRQVERFGAYYTTTVKVLEKGKRWKVTTVPKFTEAKILCLYENEFTSEGDLVATSNYHAKSGKVTFDGKVYDYDESMKVSNSTIFWCQRKFLLDAGIPLPPLTTLVRKEVSNDQTQDTARSCYLLSCELAVFPVKWGHFWSVDDPHNACALAMLGTPNGLGAVYLVRDWGTELGLTGIDFIEVEKPGPQTNRQVDVSIVFTRAK